MGNFVIEKGIPAPDVPDRPRCIAKEMDVGDSFETDDSPYISTIAGAWSKRYAPRKFIGRKQKNGQRRIWRVE